MSRGFRITLICLFTVFFGVPWLFNESLYGKRGYIVLDLKTGDMDVHYSLLDFQKNYRRELPKELRARILAESLPLAEKDRFITIAPARAHSKESGSGMNWDYLYSDNLRSIGLWLTVKPEVFGDRLRQYQQYLLASSHADKLPEYYTVPEENVYVFEDGNKKFEELRKNGDVILKEKIWPRNQ